MVLESSVGVALDWMSPIGPMNFTLAYPITKKLEIKLKLLDLILGTTF